MSPQRPARSWSVLAATLAILLIATLALGAWARWRPVTEYDVARLTARGTVARLLDSPVSGHEVPEATLQRQLAALGPGPTPSQRARLAEITETGRAEPNGLPGATAQLRELAATEDDPRLAAVLAGIAASWSAAHHREHPGAAPLMRVEARPAHSNDDERCRAALTSVVTELDRAGYVADAAAARLPSEGYARATLDTFRKDAARIEQLPGVASLFPCHPHPARGAYALPRETASDPAKAAATAADDLSRTGLDALATTDESERSWLMDALETSARASAQLSPKEPVPALAGRP